METQSKREMWEVLELHQLPEPHLMYELSGMLSDGIKKFKAIWTSLPLEIKRQLITSMKDISEADFTADFSDLFTLGLESDDPVIIVTALEGLSGTEDIRLLPRLYHLVEDNKDEDVKAAAVQFLGFFVLLGEFEKIPAHKFNKTVNYLIDTYNIPDETIQVKRRVLEALSYTAIRDIPKLIEAAYHSPDEDMMISAVVAMGRSADKRWSDYVMKELLNPNPETRYEATRACGELQIREAVQDLIELTDDTDIQVQEMALWSLGQIGGTRARRTIEKFTLSENETLRLAADLAIDELDFFENGISSFLGPPSEFNGEGDESWLSPEGFMIGDDIDLAFDDETLEDDLYDPDDYENGTTEDNYPEEIM